MDNENDTGNGQSAYPGSPGSPGLNLDARQRAMLEEMGVRVWWPVAAGAADAMGRAAAPAPAAAPRTARALSAERPNLPTSAVASAAPRATPAPEARQLPATAQPAAAAAQTANAFALPGAFGTPGAWTLQAPQLLFPNADPQRTPAALGAGWLVVVEGRAGSDPLSGDAGRLLENMLRALQLHHHPRTFVCLLDAAQPAGDAPAPAGSEETLESAIAAVQPAVLLLLGRTVARALLGRSDPLGRLRAEHLQVAGVPTVVSYDAPYLLRAPPETKALVWADLCRARALAGAAAVAAGAGADDPHG